MPFSDQGILISLHAKCFDSAGGNPEVKKKKKKKEASARHVGRLTCVSKDGLTVDLFAPLLPAFQPSASFVITAALPSCGLTR